MKIGLKGKNMSVHFWKIDANFYFIYLRHWFVSWKIQPRGFSDETFLAYSSVQLIPDKIPMSFLNKNLIQPLPIDQIPRWFLTLTDFQLLRISEPRLSKLIHWSRNQLANPSGAPKHFGESSRSFLQKSPKYSPCGRKNKTSHKLQIISIWRYNCNWKKKAGYRKKQNHLIKSNDLPNSPFSNNGHSDRRSNWTIPVPNPSSRLESRLEIRR